MLVAAAYRAVWDRLPVRRCGKSGLSAGVLTMTPSPWMLRRTGRIYPLRSSRREQVADRRPARCTTALSVTTVWLGRSDCSRRDDATVGKTVRERLRAPAAAIRHRTLRPAGYRHDVRLSCGSIQAAAVIDQHASPDEPDFPRRRTGAKSQPTPSSLRQGAPVSRRYAPVENALEVEGGGSLTPGSFDEPSVRVGVRSTRSPLSR